MLKSRMIVDMLGFGSEVHTFLLDVSYVHWDLTYFPFYE